MVEPTGYSALDLIGFTDRGDYAAGSTYVRNDLVHYNDNIWKCKFDDTTGQTPIEGTYWTLWIDGNSTLSDLSDTAITSPSNGDVLEYDSITNKWKNSGALSSLKDAFTNNVNNNGCKNLLPFDKFRDGSTKFSQNGCTGTITENGITFSGTSSAGVYPNSQNFILKKGTYVLSCEGLTSCGFANFKLYKVADSSNIVYILATDTNEYKEFTVSADVEVRAEFATNDSGVTFSGTVKPMYCLKTDWDLSNTWEPSTKTNRQLTEDSVTWTDEAQIGAVNFCMNNAITQTKNTVVFTVDSSTKEINVNGTNNSSSSFVVEIASVADNFVLKKGTYRLSGCPDGSVSDAYRLQIYDTSGATAYAIDRGDGAIFTLAQDTQVRVTIRIGGSASVSNKTFKPMIAPISYNGPYVPPAKTNKELTDDAKLEDIGFTNTASGITFSTSSYVLKKSGIVDVYFGVAQSIADNTEVVVFTLPSGCRPKGQIIGPIYRNGFELGGSIKGWVRIKTNGEVSVHNSSGAAYEYLGTKMSFIAYQ